MSLRFVRLLHIEDDEFQQHVLAHHLAVMREYDFDIHCAESEETALEAFRLGSVEFVILDYQLAQGNGLSCLRQLRQLDSRIPIVAISGVATPQIAAELLHAGADDYISKSELSSSKLASSVRLALARVDAWKRHAPAAHAERLMELQASLRQACETFAASVSDDLRRHLDHFEAIAREANLGAEELWHLFETTCGRLESTQPPGNPPVKRLLSPILLEMLLRLFWSAEDLAAFPESRWDKARCPQSREV
jgi:DNA-binding response OmpR family regulator